MFALLPHVAFCGDFYPAYRAACSFHSWPSPPAQVGQRLIKHFVDVAELQLFGVEVPQRFIRRAGTGIGAIIHLGPFDEFIGCADQLVPRLRPRPRLVILHPAI